MMMALNKRQDESKTLARKLSMPRTRFGEMLDEYKASSDCKQTWAIAFSLVPENRCHSPYYSMLWRALASVEIPYTFYVTLDLFVYEKRPSFDISRLPLIIIASPPGGGLLSIFCERDVHSFLGSDFASFF